MRELQGRLEEQKRQLHQEKQQRDVQVKDALDAATAGVREATMREASAKMEAAVGQVESTVGSAVKALERGVDGAMGVLSSRLDSQLRRCQKLSAILADRKRFERTVPPTAAATAAAAAPVPTATPLVRCALDTSGAAEAVATPVAFLRRSSSFEGRRSGTQPGVRAAATEELRATAAAARARTKAAGSVAMPRALSMNGLGAVAVAATAAIEGAASARVSSAAAAAARAAPPISADQIESAIARAGSQAAAILGLSAEDLVAAEDVVEAHTHHSETAGRKVRATPWQPAAHPVARPPLERTPRSNLHPILTPTPTSPPTLLP